jgi:hypothetical protein
MNMDVEFAMTSPQSAASRLRIKSPFIDGLTPRELDEVLAAARECRFFAGTVLASQSTPANLFFLLVSGRFGKDPWQGSAALSRKALPHCRLDALSGHLIPTNYMPSGIHTAVAC